MTNEEARAILEEVETIDDSMYQYNPAYLEALEMAIEALKQPTDGIYITHKVYSDLCLRAAKVGDLERELAEKKAEPCGDCVRISDVVKVLTNNRVHFCDMVKITSEFKTLPPVTPKQRMGKWIHEEDALGYGGYYRCSCCGKSALYRRGAMKMINEKTTFCPHCGAEMEGKSE